MRGKMGISIVIPVFNSAGTIKDLCDELIEVLNGIPGDHEIVLVEDGGSDGSWCEIKKLARNYPCVRGFCLERNYGQQNALYVGILNAKCEITVTMDDDSQYPPSQILALLREYGRGFDLVYGLSSKRAHSLFRRMTTYVFKYSLMKIWGISSAGSWSSFRMFRSHLISKNSTAMSGVISIDSILMASTDHYGIVEVEHKPRKSGGSSYTLRKLFILSFDLLKAFKVNPLKPLIYLGSGISLVSLAWFFYSGFGMKISVGNYFSIFSLLIGALLLLAGIFGKTLTADRSQSRVLPYRVKETT